MPQNLAKICVYKKEEILPKYLTYIRLFPTLNLTESKQHHRL